jgi:surface protein
MLYRHTALTDISALADWDTSRVVSMFGLLYGAKSLKSALALKNWDTSNVEDMRFLFAGDVSLEYVDVSNWNTSKVTTMSSMFQVGEKHAGNGQLREILGLGDLDVSNVTDMTCMFYGAGNMTYYDVARWDVSKVESMNHMFCDNYELKSLDLSAWDVSSVKTIYCMFDDAQKLKTIGDVSHWNTVSLIDAGGWLNDARSFIGDNLGTLDLSGWNTSNLQAAGEMFLRTKLHAIDLSGWTFDSVTNARWDGAGRGIYYESGNDSEVLKGFGQMFKDSKDLTMVYVSQSGLDSFNGVVETGVNIEDMWTGTNAKGFTVK